MGHTHSARAEESQTHIPKCLALPESWDNQHLFEKCEVSQKGKYPLNNIPSQVRISEHWEMLG
ncbi:MAG: hypothetical protein AMJ53_15730, partial [Gammaproteobacteria bacterium SG8_11]